MHLQARRGQVLVEEEASIPDDVKGVPVDDDPVEDPLVGSDGPLVVFRPVGGRWLDLGTHLRIGGVVTNRKPKAHMGKIS